MKRPKKRTNRKGHWQDVSNWRQLFISYANGMGFDPLRAENWTNVTKSQIRTKKVFYTCILTPHTHNFILICKGRRIFKIKRKSEGPACEKLS